MLNGNLLETRVCSHKGLQACKNTVNKIMKLTKKQFSKIEHLMPIPRKPPEISNYQFLCALLYMIENGCKWKALPKKFGKWHTIYMKFNRWSKNGTIQIPRSCRATIPKSPRNCPSRTASTASLSPTKTKCWQSTTSPARTKT